MTEFHDAILTALRDSTLPASVAELAEVTIPDTGMQVGEYTDPTLRELEADSMVERVIVDNQELWRAL